MGNGRSKTPIMTLEAAVQRIGLARCRKLEQGFHRARGHGPLTEEVFRTVIVAEMFPTFPIALSRRLFQLLDVNRRGELSVQQFVCGIALITKGTLAEQLSMLCLFYDRSGVGVILKEDLRYFLDAMNDGKGLKGGGLDFRAAKEAIDELYALKGGKNLELLLKKTALSPSKRRALRNSDRESPKKSPDGQGSKRGSSPERDSIFLGLKDLKTKQFVTYEDFSEWAAQNFHNPLCLWLSVVQLSFDKLQFDRARLSATGGSPNPPPVPDTASVTPFFDGWGRDVDMDQDIETTDPTASLPLTVAFGKVFGLSSSFDYIASKILALVDIKAVTSLWQVNFTSANDLNTLYHAVQSTIQANSGSRLVDFETLDDEIVSKLSQEIPRALLERIFASIDQTDPVSYERYVDVVLFALGLVWFCTQNIEYCLELCFHLYDDDRDNRITFRQLRSMLIDSYVTVSAMSITSRLPSLPTLRRRATTGNLLTRKRSSLLSQFQRGQSYESNNAAALELASRRRGGSPSFSRSTSTSPGRQDEVFTRVEARLRRFYRSHFPLEAARSSDVPDDKLITLVTYKQWYQEDADARDFAREVKTLAISDLLSRPQSLHEERVILRNVWANFDPSNPGTPGTEWFLLSSKWWNDYCSYIGLPGIDLDSNHVTLDGRGTTESHEAEQEEVNLPASHDEGIGSPGEEPTRPLEANPPTVNPMAPPGPIDNKALLVVNTVQKLRANIHFMYDYIVVSHRVWSVLHSWYGGGVELCRRVIDLGGGQIELELYPLTLRYYFADQDTGEAIRNCVHSLEASRTLCIARLKEKIQEWLAFRAVDAVFEVEMPAKESDEQKTGEKTQRYTFNYERKAFRLWSCQDDCIHWQLIDVKDSKASLDSLQYVDGQQILIELQRPDGTYPRDDRSSNSNREERGSTVRSDRDVSSKSSVSGTVGLYNLGNTCYMNSAIQCLSHTPLFKEYFTNGDYLYDINTKNPLGAKGTLAVAYGSLISAIWNGNQGHSKIAPRNLKETIGKVNSQFSGLQQQDAQEFLSVLLATLSEDLNRVTQKPYVEQQDSDGRPDEVVADEWWKNHVKREASIITAVFTGQFKSLLTCTECGFESARFEPFLFLQLPLPEPTTVKVLVTVFPLYKRIECAHQGEATSGEEVQLVPYRMTVEVPLGSCTVMRVLEKVAASPFWEKKGPLCAKPTIRDLVAVQLRDHFIMRRLTAEQEISPARNLTEKASGNDPGQLTLSVYQVESAVLHDEGETDGEESDTDSISAGSTVSLDVRLPSGGDIPVSLYQEGQLVLAEYNGPKLDGMTNSARNFLPAVVARVNSDKSLDVEYDTTDTTVQTREPLLGFRLDPRKVCRIVNPKSVIIYLVHRRLQLMPFYFASPFKPVSFGWPMVFRLIPLTVTGRTLYETIYQRLSLLLHPFAPTLDELRKATMENGVDVTTSRTCRGSFVNQEFLDWGFRICRVNRTGIGCSNCSWAVGCLGCPIPAGDSKPALADHETLAIDWGTELIKFYNPDLGTRVYDDESIVSGSSARDKIETLEECLHAFTKEERLKAFCSKCTKTHKEHRETEQVKVLNIWKLPPVLIIQMKRFKFAGIKNHKLDNLVSFPVKGLDMSPFLAPVRNGSSNEPLETATSPTTDASATITGQILLDDQTKIPVSLISRDETKFDLYAVVNHSGQLGAGHFTAYVKLSPCGSSGNSDRGEKDFSKWFCFDDSKVYEVNESDIESNGAYLLFYVRKDMKGAKISELMPRAHLDPVNVKSITPMTPTYDINSPREVPISPAEQPSPNGSGGDARMVGTKETNCIIA